jgi:outer membrane lipoprotein-sorting protein
MKRKIYADFKKSSRRSLFAVRLPALALRALVLLQGLLLPALVAGPASPAWAAAAVPALEQPGQSMIAGTPSQTDGAPILKSLIEKVKSFKDYEYESTLTTIGGRGKAVTESGRFYFKAPQMVRFEAIKAGSRSGSVVVKQPDGKIKGKAGGLLGAITITLSPDSKLLKTSNGYNILESDLSTLLAAVRSAVASGNRVLATQQPSPFPGLPKVYILELVGQGDSVVQRIALDADRKLPVSWSIFNDGKLFSVMNVSKLAVNANITDNLFVLGGISNDGKSIGVPAVPLDNILQSKIDAMGKAGVLNAEIVKDAGEAVTEMERVSRILKDGGMSEPSTESPGTETWSLTGRQRLMGRTARIESLVAPLRNLQHLVKTFESTHKDCAGISAQWNEDLDSIDQSVAKLYLLLDKDAPDQEVIQTEAENIRGQAGFLDALVLKISENLQ